MTTTPLVNGWTLRHTGGTAPDDLTIQAIPATVPGSVHTDLLDAGLIEDPYIGLAEQRLAWMKDCDWQYTTQFTAEPLTPGERCELIFEGIDTVATITLNGHHIADTANQHRTYSFDITDHLTDNNTLTVDFASAIAAARNNINQLGDRPRAYDNPFNMVRKMACSFGWDWGPDLQTAGLWKPVTLERWHTVRAHNHSLITTVDDNGTGHITATTQLTWAPEATQPADITIALADGYGLPATSATVTVTPGDTYATVTLDVPDAPLWWPAGYGEQPLFDATLTLNLNNETTALLNRRIGFRTITANTTPDDHGTPFTLIVNGQPIFVRGANWIPDDHLLTRITRNQLEHRILAARDANMNLLRIWGGGIYETHDFYDLCSQHGLLVWQDFLLACGAYPEEEPFWSEFEAEARDNITRLTPYPALAVWNGGNENLWGYLDWGWKEELAGKTWGLGYYTDLFPRLLNELDPTRIYCAGSPYSPGFTQELATGTTTAHPNDQHHGTRHEWEVWNRQDHLTHLDYTPRFCSEFGHQGPPTWSTLTTAVAPEALHKESAEFLLHQKAEDGNNKLDKGLAPHLPLPTDFEDWHWATQLSQSHSVTFGIEHFRSRWPHTAGAIVWQLNDCWPVTSWAAIDSHGHNKPLYYGLQHAYAPRLITVKPAGDTIGAGEGATARALGAEFGQDLPNGRDALGQPIAYLINDTADPWTGHATITRRTLSGNTEETTTVTVDIAPWSVGTIPLPQHILTTTHPTNEYVTVELGDTRTFHYLTELKNLTLDPGAVTVTDITPAPHSAVARGTAETGTSPVHITVHATSLAVDVALLVDRLNPHTTINDQLITLNAGENHTFTITTTLSPQDIRDALNNPATTHRIVRSVNSLIPG
ncbi:glycoside hydrolase family 2 protein [Jonesia quinghaiensis]|uniref:glycoside hydrolase family 2 protein n=1 Tax=Jonesia quinghaiensis TaxID=262806 RepID=UPI00041331C3|nr:beta-mannosidase [Jonesia quinghaiensis]